MLAIFPTGEPASMISPTLTVAAAGCSARDGVKAKPRRKRRRKRGLGVCPAMGRSIEEGGWTAGELVNHLCE